MQLQSPGPWLARVWCEILPVACVEGRIVTLARQPGPTPPVPGWCHELPSGRHPTEAVVHELTCELGGSSTTPPRSCTPRRGATNPSTWC